jgi:outer membrane protein TolC
MSLPLFLKPQRLAVLLSALLAAGALRAACIDESQAEPRDGAPTPGEAAPDPRATLQGMVREALERSQQVGAAKLLAEAALDDLGEARAAGGVQASLGLNLGPEVATSNITGNQRDALQARATLSAGQTLWDGGRLDRTVDWRNQLAESARYGLMSTREQLALQTVSLALERSRFRQHVVVYGQYVRKMGCLVEALETIVRTDRGRASELVQAKKSLQQAEISQAGAQSQARQVEVRLRRLIGDGLPSSNGLSSVLLTVPELERLVADVDQSADIAALAAQAAAADRYAGVVAAANKPQLSWNFNGSQAVGGGGNRGNVRNGALSVGVALSIPLLNPGQDSANAAALKRARAADLQRAEALESRRFRVAEVYEQTQSSFDRVRRLGAVLRDSEQVRNFTLQQWQQLGKRSLFDVIGAEGEHYNLRISYINALTDGQQLNANLLSLGHGVGEWLR